MTPERRATAIAMATAGMLAAIKTLVGFASGSMSVLASATDSLGDLFVSFINFLAVEKSVDPEDHDHNYGHGKIEGFAALFEGLVIAGSAVTLVFFSIEKLLAKAVITRLDSSLLVMIFSMIATFFLVRYLRGMTQSTGSLIIKADELHYRTDLITNGGVLIALIVIKLSGLILIDAVVSITISIYILYSAFGIMREGFHMLMDHSVSEELRVDIIHTIESASPRVRGYHCLRTRVSGKTTFIDAHVVFDSEISLHDAHEISDQIEKSLQSYIA